MELVFSLVFTDRLLSELMEAFWERCCSLLLIKRFVDCGDGNWKQDLLWGILFEALD